MEEWQHFNAEGHIEYRESDFVNNLISIINRVADRKVSPIKLQAAPLRDHLMYVMAIGNAARSSNLMHLTLHDFSDAVLNEEYDRFMLRNVQYKTSLLYSDKLLTFPVLKTDIISCILLIYFLTLQVMLVAKNVFEHLKI